jgi:hypothetical protein
MGRWGDGAKDAKYKSKSFRGIQLTKSQPARVGKLARYSIICGI